MHEYMSLKVSSSEHADLATQLTTLSTQGWSVVNIVSTGVDLIAYLSRQQSSSTVSQTGSTAQPANAPADNSTGWAAVGTQAASSVTPSASPSGPSASTPVAASTPAVPADWYPDPSRRYEYRYWDGTKWTDNVSRAGVMYKDPPIP